MTYNKQISLKAARVNTELSVDEAAERVGLTGPVLRKIENGQRRVTATEFKALCDLYGFTLDDIFLPEKERN